MAKVGVPKHDSSGRGVRANRGRGGCATPRKTGLGQKAIRRWKKIKPWIPVAGAAAAIAGLGISKGLQIKKIRKLRRINKDLKRELYKKIPKF